MCNLLRKFGTHPPSKMLRLVTKVRRVGGGHPLHHCDYSSHPVALVPNFPATVPLWQPRIRLRHHFITTNPQLHRFIQSGLHGSAHLPSLKPCSNSLSNVCSRGFSTDSTALQPGFSAWYLRMLDKYPLPTKSVTAANILAFADMTAQYLANKTLKEGEAKQEWDKMRTLRMLGIGAFFTAPILHMWFNLMQWGLPKTDVASSFKKVLVGQLMASPVVNSAFFAVNSFLQGESGEQAIEKIKRDLWPTWKSGAMYWPILDFVTFRYVPIHLQVFFNNCCSFIWTIYLTSMAGKKAEASSAKTEQITRIV